MTPAAPPRPPPPTAAFWPTHGEVLRIALPMMLAYLSSPLVGLVATGVAGRLGSGSAIAGIALAAVIFDVIFVSFNFLRGSTTGFTAQSVGAGDRAAEHQALIGGLTIALISGAALLAVHAPLGRLALDALGATGDARAEAEAYYAFRIWSAPFALANYVLFGWIIGRGEAVTALLLQTLLNGGNILFSIWLGLGMGMGSAGIGLAATLAEVATAVAGAAVALRRTERAYWLRPTLAQLRALMSVNADMMIRSFSLLLGLSFFTRQSGQLGEDILATNTILLRLFFFGVAFLDGVSTAAEQLAGRAVGARARAGFFRVVRLTAIWGLILAAAEALAFWAGAGAMIAMISPGPEIEAMAQRYLPYLIALPLIGATAFQMDGVYIGATWSRAMRNLMVASLVCYIALSEALQATLGNDGLWLALLAFNGMRSIAFRLMMPRLADKTFGPAASPPPAP